jgi:fructokinase
MLALVGETLVDLVLEEEHPLRFTGALGGSVLNTASALARLGLPVRFFSEVGTDWLSLWCEGEMERRRLNPRLFRHPAPMPLALVRPDREGNAHYSFHRPFQAPYRPEAEAARGAWAFHFGSLLALEARAQEGMEALLEAAQGALLSYDPNLRNPPTPRERALILGYLERVDLLKLSWDDARLLFDDPLEAVRRLPPTLKVLTLGPEGAVAFLGEVEVRVPGERVDVVDTVGAGDTFTAGLLALLFRKGLARESLPSMGKETLEEVLKGAVALSALACTVRGAGLPEEGLKAWRARFLRD